MTDLSDQLRKLAKVLRESAPAIDAEKQEKCAHLVNASEGLMLLKKKLGLP